MTEILGVDYSSGRPGGAALAAAGKKFAIRYVAYGGYAKGLTKPELDDLQAHGIAVCLNYESTANRALDGIAAGVADAKQSKAQASFLGFPDTTPIYFSVDFDARQMHQDAIDNYLRGAASVLGLARVGVYGSAGLVDRCRVSKTAAWFWQTYAWSYGAVRDFIHLYQYLNSQRINGAAVDLDRAMQPLYGQWAPLPASSTDPALGVDMAISTGGLTLSSQHQITLPPGTLIFENAAGGSPVLMKTPTTPTTYDYFGASGGFHAVRVDPPNSTTVIAYTTSAASVVDKPPLPPLNCDAAVKAATDPLIAKIAAAKVALGA